MEGNIFIYTYMNMPTCIHVCMHVYIYIYMEERERERETESRTARFQTDGWIVGIGR